MGKSAGPLIDWAELRAIGNPDEDNLGAARAGDRLSDSGRGVARQGRGRLRPKAGGPRTEPGRETSTHSRRWRTPRSRIRGTDFLRWLCGLIRDRAGNDAGYSQRWGGRLGVRIALAPVYRRSRQPRPGRDVRRKFGRCDRGFCIKGLAAGGRSDTRRAPLPGHTPTIGGPVCFFWV